jgi:hypothetical protein
MPKIFREGELLTKSIIVQTREGRDVPNSQSVELPYAFVGKYPGHRLLAQPGVEAYGSPTGVYNCHGLTFASRRTQITDTLAVRGIMEDDHYVAVMGTARPGDIALYIDDDGDIEHSGMVVAVPRELPSVPTVLSKWGTGHEVMHPANVCPYTVTNVRYYRQK